MIDEIIELAKVSGFEAALLNPSDLEFDFTFRKYCEQNLCGNFGTSPCCPPLCPSAEELRAEVLKCKYVLVLKSNHDIPDLTSRAAIKAAQEAHNREALQLISKIPDFSGCLALCSSTDTEIPKGITAACLSAYCVNVLKMAERCNMTYAYKDTVLALFGFITSE